MEEICFRGPFGGERDGKGENKKEKPKRREKVVFFYIYKADKSKYNLQKKKKFTQFVYVIVNTTIHPFYLSSVPSNEKAFSRSVKNEEKNLSIQGKKQIRSSPKKRRDFSPETLKTEEKTPPKEKRVIHIPARRK